MAARPSWINRAGRGVKRHPWRFLIAVGVALAALWGPTEPIAATYPTLTKPTLLFVLLALAITIAAARVAAAVDIGLRWGSTRIRISVGDLFDHPGPIAVPADDLFLVAHSKLVTTRSLIGQLGHRTYGGNVSLLAQRLAAALKGVRGDRENAAPVGNSVRYPVGTTVVLEEPSKKVFVTAFCSVDLSTQTGTATTQDVLVALNSLWGTIGQHRSGEPVAVPLFGSGQSGCGLSPSALLHLQLLSLAAYTREHVLPDPIHIVLPPSMLTEINLAAMREVWSDGGMNQ